VAFHTSTASQLAGSGLTAGNREDPSHGVGVRRVPVVFEPLTDGSRPQHPRCACQRVGVGGVDVGSEFVEELVVGAEQVGGAVEQHGDVSLGDVVEQWDQLVTDPVATETAVVVGRIVYDRETELLAQCMGFDAPKGEDGMAPPGPDCPEAGGARTPDQGEEQGFGLVVCGVAGHGVRSEGRPPGAAGSCFEVGAVVEVDVDRAELDAELSGGRPCDVGVDIGRLAETMVDVHGSDPALGCDREGDERRGVGSTGQSADDGGAFRWEGATAEEFGGVGQRWPALFGDRYRSVWWAERCLRLGCCLAETDHRYPAMSATMATTARRTRAIPIHQCQTLAASMVVRLTRRGRIGPKSDRGQPIFPSPSKSVPKHRSILTSSSGGISSLLHF